MTASRTKKRKAHPKALGAGSALGGGFGSKSPSMSWASGDPARTTKHKTRKTKRRSSKRRGGK